MSTYLLAFIVSDFVSIQSTQNSNLLVRNVCSLCLFTSAVRSAYKWIWIIDQKYKQPVLMMRRVRGHITMFLFRCDLRKQQQSFDGDYSLSGLKAAKFLAGPNLGSKKSHSWQAGWLCSECYRADPSLLWTLLQCNISTLQVRWVTSALTYFSCKGRNIHLISFVALRPAFSLCCRKEKYFVQALHIWCCTF